jgi:hypothetical protein
MKKAENIFLKKVLIISFFIVVFLWIFNTYWEENKKMTCKYAWKIEKCLQAQGATRTIEDFVCIDWNKVDVTIQVILDEKFKEIDKKIEDYLWKLEDAKDHYFWPNKKEQFTNAINDIEKYLGEWWEFEKEYEKLCNWVILSEAIECLWWTINNIWANSYLLNLNNTWDCRKLYKFSLSNYKSTAYAILKENKAQILHDEHKKFTQKQRWKFDKLLDQMIVNKGYLDDVSSDVQSTTKYPH